MASQSIAASREATEPATESADMVARVGGELVAVGGVASIAAERRDGANLVKIASC